MVTVFNCSQTPCMSPKIGYRKYLLAILNNYLYNALYVLLEDVIIFYLRSIKNKFGYKTKSKPILSVSSFMRVLLNVCVEARSFINVVFIPIQ